MTRLPTWAAHRVRTRTALAPACKSAGRDAIRFGIARVLSFSVLCVVLTAPAQADGRLRPLLAGGEPSLAESDQEPRGEAVCVRGRLSDEGIECPAFRGENGTLFTLAGDTSPFGTGDEVCVCGTVADVSFCMQGTTIAVTHISSGQGDCPP